MALAFALAGCAPVDKETQITVVLEAETEIPKELDSFAVRVISTRTGELRFSKDYEPANGREFPTTLAVIPLDEDALASPIQIELEGRKGTATFLRRRSVITYRKERNLLLAMPLRMACFQFQDCGPNATCAGGQCTSATINTANLASYERRFVFPEGGACFDEERCLGDARRVTVAEDCTFEIPADVTDANGNAAIRWEAAPNRLLALGADDAQEGWTRVNRTRGRLSQGVCDSHFRRLAPNGELLVPDFAKEVLFSGTCPSKTSTLPYCFSERTQHSGIGAIVPETP